MSHASITRTPAHTPLGTAIALVALALSLWVAEPRADARPPLPGRTSQSAGKSAGKAKATVQSAARTNTPARKPTGSAALHTGQTSSVRPSERLPSSAATALNNRPGAARNAGAASAPRGPGLPPSVQSGRGSAVGVEPQYTRAMSSQPSVAPRLKGNGLPSGRPLPATPERRRPGGEAKAGGKAKAIEPRPLPQPPSGQTSAERKERPLPQTPERRLQSPRIPANEPKGHYQALPLAPAGYDRVQVYDTVPPNVYQVLPLSPRQLPEQSSAQRKPPSERGVATSKNPYDHWSSPLD